MIAIDKLGIPGRRTAATLQWLLLVHGVLFSCAHVGFAQGIPKGYIVPPITCSPDHRYGITVPKLDDDASNDPLNSVFDLRKGSSLGHINADVAFDHMNHDAIAPTLWASGDSAFLWLVDGKWGFSTEILVLMQDGEVGPQTDVLALLQQEMLDRLRKAVPKQYAVVKARSAGDGSWFRDGFAIDCVPDQKTGPLKFPIRFHCFLTSDTKDADSPPKVEARMTAQMGKDGVVEVTEFHLGTEPTARNW